MSIVEFLEARIGEDEKLARDAAESDPSIRAYTQEGPAGEQWTACDGMVEGETDALWDCEGSGTLCTTPEVSEHMARHDPARVLAECAAKRAIIAEHGWRTCANAYDEDVLACETCGAGDYPYYTEWPCPTIRALAAVYADHPYFSPDWA